MRTHGLAFVSAHLIAAAVTQAASGVTLWDEAVNGDLSNDRFNPTALNLAMGVNSITATSVSGDREYVALTLAPGTQLSAVNLVSYTGVDGTAFIAVQVGGQLTEPPTGTDAANLLGWTHFGSAEGNVGTDILDDMGIGSAAIGFVPPLPANTYTFWMQQTGANPSTFQFDFIVDVPGPGGLPLAAIAMIGWRRRSR